MTEGQDVARRLECSIDSLTGDKQKALILELTDYASFLIRTKAAWVSRGVLPRGYDAGGLALEAISRVLDGRRRDWDPEKEPTLLAYLKSVVKSIFSTEIVPAAERERDEISATDSQGNDRTMTVPSTNPGPEAEVELDELKERIYDSFEVEEDQLVLMCLFEGVTTPAAIADKTGLGQSEVYRIKQKIKRRLVGLSEEG